MKSLYRVLFVIIIFAGIFSCVKDEFIDDPDASLNFSEDTVMFDTVFTTIGSTTAHLKIYNPYNENIIVNSLYLAGGKQSNFRINVDGVKAESFKDVEISGNDSIYIFVEVTVDPNGINSPMVIQDSIVFIVNGNLQDVDLVAYGQDFNLFNSEVIQSQTWTNDKPYLVYNSVLVDSLSTLTIEAGTQIHFHKRSSMLVKGTIIVNGTVDDPVYFQGDRLESFYDDKPGQWGSWMEFEEGGIYLLGGIHFLAGSKDNYINYAVIKNAIKGIQADTLANPAQPTLTLLNTRIENMSYAGIYAQGSTILAANCVVANCGSHAVALMIGGSYEFYHCTIANYYRHGTRTSPSVILNNFYIVENTVYPRPLERANFTNCIIDGSLLTEVEMIDTIQGVSVPAAFNFKFDHCILKVDTMNISNEDHFSYILKNVNPGFVSTYNYDYHLDTLSPAKDYGDIEISKYFPLDLDNKSRLSDDGPDIGAYERIEK